MTRFRTPALALGGLVAAGTAFALFPQSPSAAPAKAPIAKPASSPRAAAPPLPSPKDFVSGLDLECFETPGEPLDKTIKLTHLNPVLLELGMKPHEVRVRELVQSCFPIIKNNVVPPAFDFVRHVDFACFRLEAEALANPVNLTLEHLNPVLAQFERHEVKLVNPETLCVPVMKNGVEPPEEVYDLVRHLDLECWKVDASDHPAFGLFIRHINPLLVNLIPGRNLHVQPEDRRLCVPVQKEDQHIPEEVLNIIRWVDLEMFRSLYHLSDPVALVLRHLNPLFVDFPEMPVVLERANQLMVPVAKNGAFPPGQ